MPIEANKKASSEKLLAFSFCEKRTTLCLSGKLTFFLQMPPN